MARITVEDCLEQIPNRFDLVLTATQRARQLSHGREPKLETEKDKPSVVALREIAAGLITRDIMRDEEIFFAAAQAEQEREFTESDVFADADSADELDKMLAEQLQASVAAAQESGDEEPDAED